MTPMISPGFPLPYGASPHKKGVNFALFSKHATGVTLLLFEKDQKTPYLELPLDPKVNKTGSMWHVFIHDLPEDLLYGYRLEGPYDPLKGHYFDPQIIVLDPYAKLVASPPKWGTPRQKSKDTLGHVRPIEPFHWEEDSHPNIPFEDLIIYEMHVRSFTQDPSSGVSEKGTFLGMIEKIPHLKSLGVNAVELMPIFEFNERENIRVNPKTGEPLFQYWGYSTLNFFSPMRRFGTEKGNTITEFKQLVKELHKAGIEVILDVVYNHTSEGNESGPILSFKGIENSTYYLLGPSGEYYNFSGCGNTFNCNHPVVRELIRDSLRYWVTEMHVDGFRFDLASILVRSHEGIPLERPPLIEMIAQDPILSSRKIIAEAWDAGGLYQVGSFPRLGVWREWNGRYRDNMRRFLKGTDGEIGAFATRLSGSEDLYGRSKSPTFSINFITAHDGFTLADLVSYNDKHNEENGEDNRDGTSQNDSWNCGAEGATNDPKILEFRQKQMRNFHVALMVSQGIPMVLMGDEYGHTRFGNNNSWEQDSPLNWFLWDALEQNQEFFNFYKEMIAFRKNHPILKKSTFLKPKDVAWHGKELNKPDWSLTGRVVAFSLIDKKNKYELYIAFNVSFDEQTFQLPPSDPKAPWKVIVNTSSNPAYMKEEESQPYLEKSYALPAYSSLILKKPI